MHQYEIKPHLKKILKKLFNKNRVLYEQIIDKIKKIINTNDIGHYKNLRYDLKDQKRVHIGNFVLVFSFNKSKDLISFEDFDHHDNIYKK